MGKILQKLIDRKLARNRKKTTQFRAQQEATLSNVAGAFKVFREPGFVVEIENIKCPWYTQICQFFEKFDKNWYIRQIRYTRKGSEFYIIQAPQAEKVWCGRRITLKTFIPKTNTTSEYNYWLSVLSYLEGSWGCMGNLERTVEYLGKASMGVEFNGCDPHEFAIEGQPMGRNSMYFIVDKSYIRPEYYRSYDWAAKMVNDEESPLLI